ncbi:inositol 2-dehydrogenase [Anaerotalea alkaliphila]|uniref:Inositol 2-dehydrogenase n=1 Tax=Anaerotalea alkaliphila TaxID=2662126 RepID=A0A7X5HX57_9FIRM|nr:inositol 2-dehydrogenase [Anaerotalea alkaliphila]NDL68300.1 inositol 2-dehydrogenase [Anaerotalea alkaliphila]
MSQKLTLGVIGAGRIGKLHVENIINNVSAATIKSVADVMLNEATESWAKGLGIEVVTKDYKEILADPAIDAVLVCSSTDTHAQITIEAAQAGKHIFCEKPVDLDVKKIVAALEEVKKANVKLQIGFNRRFDSNFRKLRETVDAGKVGDVHIVKVTSRDPAPPPAEYVKVSGGMFLDMTIHDFDMVRYLTNSEVVEVYASGAVLVDPAIGEAGDVDTAIINLKFENGALGVIDNSRKAAYGYDQRAEVFGSKGSISNDNVRPNMTMLSTEAGVEVEKPLYFFLERYMDSFKNEMVEFCNAVINDTDTPVVGMDGLKPVLIGLAAKKSVKEGRPVKISEIEAEFGL